MSMSRADRVALIKAQALSALKLFALFLLAATLLVVGALVYYVLGLVAGMAVATAGVLVLGGAVVRTYRFSKSSY